MFNLCVAVGVRVCPASISCNPLLVQCAAVFHTQRPWRDYWWGNE